MSDEIRYLQERGYEPDMYAIVTWPESQSFMDCEGVELINDDEGLKLFGSSAYIVPQEVDVIKALQAGVPAENVEFEDVTITAPFEIHQLVVDPEPMYNEHGHIMFPVDVDELCGVVKDIKELLDTTKSPVLLNRIRCIDVVLPSITRLWNRFSITVNDYDLYESPVCVRVVNDVLPLMASVRMKTDIGVTITTPFQDWLWKAQNPINKGKDGGLDK